MLTFEQIKELIELVTRQKLQGLELERSGFRLKIDGRAGAQVPVAVQHAPEPEVSVSAAPAQQGVGNQEAETEAAPAAAEVAVADGAHILNSPIVGTFYAAPSPEADPYVKVGDRIKKGQVLCIVEAMKLMNEIESDLDGELLQVYPKNAQPVEFGEPLFAIRPG